MTFSMSCLMPSAFFTHEKFFKNLLGPSIVVHNNNIAETCKATVTPPPKLIIRPTCPSQVAVPPPWSHLDRKNKNTKVLSPFMVHVSWRQ